MDLKNILLLIIVVFSVQCFSEDEQDSTEKTHIPPLIKTINYKDYKIELFDRTNIEFGGASAANELIISKNDKSVFHIDQGVTNVYSGYELKSIEKLDSISSPILVITETSGGSHCCWTTKILNLEDDVRIIATFDGGAVSAELAPMPIFMEQDFSI